MKRGWPARVLSTLLVVVFLVASALPAVGAAHSEAPAQSALQPLLPASVSRSAPPASAPLASQGWTTLWSEDFEGNFPGAIWTLEGDPTWGRTTYRAHGGTGSAYCAAAGAFAVVPPGPYPEDMVAWMSAGAFDLGQATEAELSFAHWTESEGLDLFAVMASTDGETWDGPSWSGDLATACGGWCTETLTLSDFPGLGNLCGQSQVWLGFAFYSDSYVVYEGTYVDDIVLRASNEAEATPTLTLTATNTRLPDASVTPTSTATSTRSPSATASATRTATATQSPGAPLRIYLSVIRRSMPEGT